MKHNHNAVFFFTVLLFVITFVFAAETTPIEDAMKQLCTDARNILAIGVMLMVIMAAVVYAVGQILGAETRARASVWATAMMTGAIIGVIIYMVVPSIIGIMAPDLNVEEACGAGTAGGSTVGSTQQAVIEDPSTIIGGQPQKITPPPGGWQKK